MADVNEIQVLVEPPPLPAAETSHQEPSAQGIPPVHVHTMPQTTSEEDRNLAAALAASLGELTRQISATATQVVADSRLRRLGSQSEFFCKICYCNDPVGDGSTSIELPCGHRWHKDCLLGMIKSKVADSQLEILCPDVPTDIDERALLDNADEVGCDTLITKEIIFVVTLRIIRIVHSLFTQFQRHEDRITASCPLFSLATLPLWCFLIDKRLSRVACRHHSVR